ncbi:hypothetical protein LY76DRAFT_38427 [Colletotrichum caudatum]|nr:hypothetical protein LY76DRAFT_38427 [Colletotrichum caudatum]
MDLMLVLCAVRFLSVCERESVCPVLIARRPFVNLSVPGGDRRTAGRPRVFPSSFSCFDSSYFPLPLRAEYVSFVSGMRMGPGSGCVLGADHEVRYTCREGFLEQPCVLPPGLNMSCCGFGALLLSTGPCFGNVTRRAII